jgi:hypothetical protein
MPHAVTLDHLEHVGLIPTSAGDVVIQRWRSNSSRYHVWTIVEHGQQLPDFETSPPWRVAGWHAAVRLALDVAGQTGGRVYALDWTTGTWTTVG